MKRLFINVLAVGLSALALTSCAPKNEKGEQAKKDYKESLSDSIEKYKIEIDSCEMQISTLRDKVDQWLRDFTTVANPREAAPYMIMTSAQNLYPLKSTGLLARINDSGQFELIAALSSKPFDRITVVSDSQTSTSDIVPNDQGLNYRTPELTTVSFTGAAADSIGMLIADNELNPVTVTYINGGKPVQSAKLSNEQSKVISYTYLFYSDRSEMQRLERRVPMLHEKINLIRLHQEEK